MSFLNSSGFRFYLTAYLALIAGFLGVWPLVVFWSLISIREAVRVRSLPTLNTEPDHV